MRLILKLFLALVLSAAVLHSKDVDKHDKMYGVTIDNINDIDDITESLMSLSKSPTVRIVFNGWTQASYYAEAVEKIHDVSPVMGELLDSYYFENYSVSQYNERVKEYLNAFGTNVDIWEIANEINGEWLGNTDTVVKKMINAYRIVKDDGKITAITFYYNSKCTSYWH